LDAKHCETSTNVGTRLAPKMPVTIQESGISPGQGLARYFPDTEEATGSSPVGPTTKSPYVARVFGDSAKRRATLCKSGVRLNFGSESFETFHGGLVETFVEVSVNVENGAGALVTKTVGDVASSPGLPTGNGSTSP
jgi:hypothetical protein